MAAAIGKPIDASLKVGILYFVVEVGMQNYVKKQYYTLMYLIGFLCKRFGIVSS